LQVLHYFDYGAIHRCGDAERYQVQLTSDDQTGVFYFQVAGNPADFRMARVATKPDPSCGGVDLLEEMETR